MDVFIIAIIMFGSLFATLMLGIPVAFAMSGISILVGFFVWGGLPSANGFLLASYGQVMQFVFTSLPLYIFMAGILRYSNLAEGMYEAFYRWFGGLKGGLAVGTTIIATLFAAMVGTTAVATATLGMTAQPSMISRNYDQKLTAGVILAGSGLGILIPPSILMIIYATLAEVSPGQMFIAGIIPGIMIAMMIIVYALVVCLIDPSKGPALPKEERYSWREKFESLKGVILPVFVIILVLASIFMGIATPTEAAAVGVVGSLISAAINRQLTWENIKKMFKMTVGLTGMIFWLIIGAAAYARIVSVTTLGKKIMEFVIEMNISPLLLVTIVFILFFILGMFMEATSILFMVAPIILPLFASMEIDLIWFGVIFILMAMIANLTPPFGAQLFILKGVVPDIELSTLYRAVIPMIILLAVGTILLAIFPSIVTWLPNRMFEY